MANDFESLKQQALLIKNEVEDGANTAERVGGILDGILDLNLNSTAEYNVSKFHPNSGINGSNKYTLETAIAQVPSKYRSIGIKCAFVNEDGEGETWEYKAGSWGVGNFLQVGYKKINDLDTDNTIQSIIQGTRLFSDLYITGFISNDGTLNSSGVLKRTGYLPIKLLKGLKLKNVKQFKYLSNAFYDASKKFLGTKNTISPDYILDFSDEVLAEFPGAEYVAISSGIEITVQQNLIEFEKQQSEKNTELDNKINSNTDSIGEINLDKLPNKANSILKGNRLEGTDWETGYLANGDINTSNPSFITTGYIPVEEGTFLISYTGADFERTYFYGNNKEKIRQISVDEDCTKLVEANILIYKVVIPKDVRFLRISFLASLPLNITMQSMFIFKDESDVKVPYANYLKDYVAYENVINRPNMQLSDNLFNKDELIEGAYYNNGYIPNNNSQYIATKNIYVKPNTKYWYIQGNTQLMPLDYCFVLNNEQVVIGALKDYKNEDGSITTPEGAYIVRLSFPKRDATYIHFGEVKAWVPYGINSNTYRITQSPFYGLEATVVGDSTTEGGQWALYVALALGMFLTVNSIGGTQVGGNDNNAMCGDNRISKINENSKVIIFAGGANDIDKRPIGTIDDEHTPNTFYGAYQLMLDKALVRCPTARMVMANVIYNNSYKESTALIREAIEAISKKYHYPLIDLLNNVGINEFNYKQFSREQYESGAWDNIHKQDTGNKRIANVFIGGMLSQVGGMGGFIENFVVVPTPQYPEKAYLTIKPTPSDAVVTIDGEQVKSKLCLLNTLISWSVSKDGYTTQSGSETLTYNDKTIDISLELEG